MVGLVMTAKHLGLGREEFRAWAHLLLGKAEGEKFTEEDYRTLEEHFGAPWYKVVVEANDSDLHHRGFRTAFRKCLRAGRPLTKEETEALLDLVVISPNEVGAWEWD